MLSLRECVEVVVAFIVFDFVLIEEEVEVLFNGECFVTVVFFEFYDFDDEVDDGDVVSSGDEFVLNFIVSVFSEGVNIVNGLDDDGEFDKDMELVGDSG